MASFMPQSGSLIPGEDGGGSEVKKTEGEDQDLTKTVAHHYNQLQETGLDVRTQSRIFYLRNFNNWIKSMAISDILGRLKREKDFNNRLTVLDLCSGKGGDLLKWKKANIDRLVCADIAGTSVEQCENRFKELVERTRRERHGGRLFSAEFITADCSKQRLKDMYKDPNIKFDLVSCQFSFHYSFESLPQAEMMLQNACECLKPGGYFLGTTPNSYELVKRLRASSDLSFGNDVYKVTFLTQDKEELPLFGAKYDFHLEGVVDCPEFLVYFPLLEKMAEKYNMRLVHRTPFAEFFAEQLNVGEGRSLLGRMQALEPYPAEEGVELLGKEDNDYTCTKQSWEAFMEKQAKSEDEGHRRKPPKVGTLSQAEWEATTIYVVFAFQKMPNSSQSSANTSQTSCNPDGRSLKRPSSSTTEHEATHGKLPRT